MGVEAKPNRTRTNIFQQNNRTKRIRILYDRLNPNRTELSDWANRSEPQLYAMGSIPIASRKHRRIPRG